MVYIPSRSLALALPHSSGYSPAAWSHCQQGSMCSFTWGLFCSSSLLPAVACASDLRNGKGRAIKPASVTLQLLPLNKSYGINGILSPLGPQILEIQKHTPSCLFPLRTTDSNMSFKVLFLFLFLTLSLARLPSGRGKSPFCLFWGMTKRYKTPEECLIIAPGIITMTRIFTTTTLHNLAKPSFSFLSLIPYSLPSLSPHTHPRLPAHSPFILWSSWIRPLFFLF